MATPNKILTPDQDPKETKQKVLHALRRFKKVKPAADALGVTEQALYRYMKKRIKRECTWIDIEETVIDAKAVKE
jgi:hypothetical protein